MRLAAWCVAVLVCGVAMGQGIGSRGYGGSVNVNRLKIERKPKPIIRPEPIQTDAANLADLDRKIEEIGRDVDAKEQALEAAKKSARERVEATDGYKAAEIKLRDAQRRRDEAKAAKRPDWLSLASEVGKAMVARDDIVSAAFAADPDVVRAREMYDAASKTLIGVKEFRRRAGLTRDKLEKAATLPTSKQTLEVGQISSLPSASVFQIIDARNMIARIRTENDGHMYVWLRGFPTAGLADDKAISITSAIEITGTTSRGGNTYYVAEPFDMTRVERAIIAGKFPLVVEAEQEDAPQPSQRRARTDDELRGSPGF